MYEQAPSVQPEFQPEAPKKSNIGLMIGIAVAIVLCCCCLVVGGFAALSIMGPLINNVYSTINQDLQTPAVPGGEDQPNLPELPGDAEGLIPQGGLGDETLRADTWFNVVMAAAFSGCAATDPTKTTIDVIQKPDAAGVWKEKWTVACDGGGSKSFEVTFTPSAQGGTDIEVTESK
ncbi:MAG: hypothetical protein DDG60_06505 [Anaerolineae bacterium]|nr:MAG: hypothetical protein DDG60_06505 [Anaerolineae bacterium]